MNRKTARVRNAVISCCIALALAGCENPLLAKAHDLKQAAVSPAINLSAPESRALAAGASFAVPAVGAPGGSVEQTFTLSNAGKTTLAVDAAGVTLVPGDGTESGCFSLSARPAATIAPGASSSLTVRFAPSAVGAKSAVLTIPSNDPATPLFTLNLSGNGLARDNAITAFGFVGAATIPVDDAASTIDYTLPYNMSASIGALRAVFVTTGSSVAVGGAAQTSGVTVNDFSASAAKPVVYTVSAADGGTRDYAVKVATANNPRVIFDANGGSGVMAPQEIPANNTRLLNANAFTRKGYDFGGWAYSQTGPKEHSDKASFYIETADFTLYALWTPITYAVAFDANGGGGTVPSNQSVVFGQSINLSAASGITPPAGSPAYVFKGWATSSTSPVVAYANGASLTMVEGLVPASGTTVTLYAVWEATVSFVANGGSGTVSAVKANRYGNATLPAGTGFSRSGYQFAGWSAIAANNGVVDHAAGAGYTLGATNVTLYAVWWPELSYSANGGSGTMASVGRQPGSAAALPANAFSRNGYSFRGWAASASSATVAYLDQAAYTMGATPANLYAVWRGTLTLNGNGATSGSMAAQPWDCHGTGALPGNPYLRNGYTFQGWATSSDTSTVSHANLASYTMGSSSATLYAVWHGTITFNANDGSGTPASATQTIGTGRSYALVANAFTRDGYTFAGWATSPSGAIAYANGATYNASSGTATLYARWSRSIEYRGNGSSGGTVPTEEPKLPGSTVTVKGNTGGLIRFPINAKAKKFVGWTTAEDGSGTVYVAGSTLAMPDAVLVFYAKWENYALGDTGPGGGLVAYVAPDGAPFIDNSNSDENCNRYYYLEAAVSDLTGGNYGAYKWSTRTDSFPSCQHGLGYGRKNSNDIVTYNGSGNAAGASRAFLGGGKSDWFLPSKDELQYLYTNLAFLNLGDFNRTSNSAYAYYWSSSTGSGTTAQAQDMWNGFWHQESVLTEKRVRPVRYF